MNNDQPIHLWFDRAESGYEADAKTIRHWRLNECGEKEYYSDQPAPWPEWLVELCEDTHA